MSKKIYKPLGSTVLIKVDTSEIKIGTFIVATDGSREAEARAECVILAMGEDAFSDLNEDNRPKINDRCIIARYDGTKVEEKRTEGFDLKLIQDSRILCLLTEEEEK